MRLLIFMICIAFISAGCSSSGSKSSGTESSEKAAISKEHLSHIHLDVSGMTCEGCENAIVASINKLEGIQEASASHSNAEATIVFDSTLTSVHSISHAIEDAGYSVDGQAAHSH